MVQIAKGIQRLAVHADMAACRDTFHHARGGVAF